MTSKRLHFNVITLMPEMFEALDFGLIGKAFRDGKVSKTLINPRDFTLDNHKTVDDRPYGGGPGMVMMLEPLVKAPWCRSLPTRPVQPSPDKRVISGVTSGKARVSWPLDSKTRCWASR